MGAHRRAQGTEAGFLYLCGCAGILARNAVGSTEDLYSFARNGVIERAVRNDGSHAAEAPFPPQVGTDNAKELEFVKRGSSYQVATAGQKAGGRGGAVTYFHGSEAAWWTNAPDHFAASVQGVDEVRGVWGVLWREPARPLPFEKGIGEICGWVKAPSEIWLETTSAGPNGEFYKRYMDALKV